MLQVDTTLHVHIASMPTLHTLVETATGGRLPRNSFSGAIDGRPTRAYIESNLRDNCVSTSSTIVRMVRSGWSFRTRASGDK